MARSPDVQRRTIHGPIEPASPAPSWRAIAARAALWLASLAFLAWISRF